MAEAAHHNLTQNRLYLKQDLLSHSEAVDPPNIECRICPDEAHRNDWECIRNMESTLAREGHAHEILKPDSLLSFSRADHFSILCAGCHTIPDGFGAGGMGVGTGRRIWSTREAWRL